VPGRRRTSGLGAHGDLPSGRMRQFSIRPEQRVQVQKRVRNYQRLKKRLEAISELNHELLRSSR